jgi:transposase
MASYVKMPHKPRVTRAWASSKHGVSAVTITKPNGEVIVIPAQPVKVANRKRKRHAHKRKRSSKPVQHLTHKVSEQDEVFIALQERREQLLREMGSIHLDSN